MKKWLKSNKRESILTNGNRILPLDLRCISQAISIYRWLKLQNAQIGLTDLLIGATALSYQLPLATLNEKHFARIPQLQWVELPSPQA